MVFLPGLADPGHRYGRGGFVDYRRPVGASRPCRFHRPGNGAYCATIVGEWQESFGETRFKQGETNMADKGKKDKGKKEQQKTAKLTPKEKRKQKKEKKKAGINAR